eukprot:6297033-Pyramimonas_sp.AAC.2
MSGPRPGPDEISPLPPAPPASIATKWPLEWNDGPNGSVAEPPRAWTRRGRVRSRRHSQLFSGVVFERSTVRTRFSFWSAAFFLISSAFRFFCSSLSPPPSAMVPCVSSCCFAASSA